MVPQQLVVRIVGAALLFAWMAGSGGGQLVSDFLSAASRDLLVSAATAGAGNMINGAARGTGWLAKGAKALQSANRAWDKVQKVKDFADTVELGMALAEMAPQIIEFMENAASEGIDEDQALDVLTDLIMDKLLGAGNCFTAETLVPTDKGLRPIGNLSVGDRVWSLDVKTGKWETRPITNVFAHHYEGELVQVQVAGTTIEATPNHPFRVVSGLNLFARPPPDHVEVNDEWDRMPGRWVSAGHLLAGDTVILAGNRPAKVESAHRRDYRGEVYNLEVTEHHTYAVGSAGVAVHNAKKMAVKRRQFRAGIATISRGGRRSTVLGQSGEVVGAAVTGLPKNTTRIRSTSGRRKYRTPDHMTDDQHYIAEDKNVKYQYLSSQLLDDKSHVLRRGGPGRVDVILNEEASISVSLLREHLNPGSPIKLRPVRM